ncbi:MAG: O-antigen ligase family protein [Acidobacteria bacterium]|nr:O-antigen ligase family protein [Acidobacteriota bacterium]
MTRPPSNPDSGAPGASALAAGAPRPAAARAVRDAGAPSRLETAAWVVLVGFVAALQVSIAAASILLTVVLALWAALTAGGRLRPAVPAFFLPLAAYAAWTLVSVAGSARPIDSLVDAKEVLLFLVVPVVYGIARGRRAGTLATVILSVGAAAAVVGIVQYAILEYDHLGRRPLGSMGHYMTYSGLLMLVLAVAGARLLFAPRDRMWAALVTPALCVALALTFTRSAWVGASVGVSLLCLLRVSQVVAQRDVRGLARTPVVAAAVFALAALGFSVAPTAITDRVYSTFDLQDPTNRDRLAMVRVGAGMVRDHPLTGVGPEMVEVLYSDYRPADAVNATNPHLHNVPLQIAAERGLPALALWGWFVVAVVVGLARRFRQPDTRPLAAAGLAAVAAMLAAGMFEYNFGDSEFLMLLLVLITLPASAERNPPAEPEAAATPGAAAAAPTRV